MNLSFKNKYILIIIIVVSTIICGIVYYFIQNNKENAYIELNNDYLNEFLVNNNIELDKVKMIKIHISGEVVSPRSY